MVPLVALGQPLRDLLDSIVGPSSEIHLSDVIDDVFDTADDDLTPRVRQMHYVVECAKNVRLEHLPISLAD